MPPFLKFHCILILAAKVTGPIRAVVTATPVFPEPTVIVIAASYIKPEAPKDPRIVDC